MFRIYFIGFVVTISSEFYIRLFRVFVREVLRIKKYLFFFVNVPSGKTDTKHHNDCEVVEAFSKLIPRISSFVCSSLLKFQ